ncbi:MAG: histidine kinase [Eubacteriales bacterium]|nr:histidine kinase [Eubacteriales bacterium]
MKKSNNIYKEILDNTNQLIQYSTLKDFKMCYANKAARNFTDHGEKDYVGEYCYKYMMGLDAVCPFCPMLSMPEGESSYETEVDNGKQVFHVKTEVFQIDGEDYFMEYASDVTGIRRAQQSYEKKISEIFRAIPEAQGIFYMNLSQNKVLMINGIATAVKILQNETKADALLKDISNYIPDEEHREKFREIYNIDVLTEHCRQNIPEVIMESQSYFSDGSIKWARLTGRLMTNPVSGDYECVFYGIDIDDEYRYRKQLQLAEQTICQAQSEQRRISEQARFSVMISQVRPHFVTNVLNTIQYFCETDPPKASMITEKFARYLRNNLKAAVLEEPVDFEEDLECLDNYLSIEKVRFPKIQFLFDIREKEFKVPPITLQPLVENAIMHGVQYLEEGGRIEVSTYREPEQGKYVIRVRDNGMGFQSEQPGIDRRVHIGVENTRYRIKTMCNGTMEIQSTSGKGTEVLIKIPPVLQGSERVLSNL